LAEIAFSVFYTTDFRELLHHVKILNKNIILWQLIFFNKKYPGPKREILCSNLIEWLDITINGQARNIATYILHMDGLKKQSLQGSTSAVARKSAFAIPKILILCEKLLYQSRWSSCLSERDFVCTLAQCLDHVCMSEMEHVALADMILSTIEHVTQQSGVDNYGFNDAAEYIRNGILHAKQRGHTLILIRILSYPYGLNVAPDDYSLSPEIQAQIHRFALLKHAKRSAHIMRKQRRTIFQSYDSDSYHSSSG
jgi:hypothetical protein